MALLYTTWKLVPSAGSRKLETPGENPERAAAIMRPWRDASVTWWMEARWHYTSLEEVRQRIRQGPPEI